MAEIDIVADDENEELLKPDVKRCVASQIIMTHTGENPESRRGRNLNLKNWRDGDFSVYKKMVKVLH